MTNTKEGSPEKVGFVIGANRRATGSAVSLDPIEKKEDAKADDVNNEEDKESARYSACL